MKPSKKINSEKILSHFVPDAKTISKQIVQTNKQMDFFYSPKNNWLVIIKKNKPITEREIEIQCNKSLKHEVVFISAFKTRIDFQKHCDAIPWKTHVWIAESPEHMIHFNGDRFMGPR